MRTKCVSSRSHLYRFLSVAIGPNDSLTYSYKVCTIALAGLLWFATSAWAEIYHWIDPDGRTHFSDHPPENPDQRLDYEGVVSRNPESTKSNLPDGPLLGPYKRLEIDSPKVDETLVQQSKNLLVSLFLDPPLMVGHLLQMYLDEAPIDYSQQPRGKILLRGLAPGSHVVEARIVDLSGTVARTASVPFQLRTVRPPGVIP